MRIIELNRGKSAIVDEADFELVSRFKWYAYTAPGWYARTSLGKFDGKQAAVSMHRLLMGDTPGAVYDHINGNGLDNRRANLRPVTRQQNKFNCVVHSQSTSKLRGVQLNGRKTAKKWMARIYCNGVPHYLGAFSDPMEAARRYDAEASKLFGAYARLNFPVGISA